ncbi:MAG TPA: hypothetical protein VFV67_09185 [Actinophytocola sp.]|uniref:hypothetical protein n=1 Tax=Actinophytocola sp. TaxID=1872138 RepID=UPI002DBE6890|nr:hypothetical protein [Actinophytocola sp.]HEU5470815.1 hypothetical protein [Actinophytocola sp.]
MPDANASGERAVRRLVHLKVFAEPVEPDYPPVHIPRRPAHREDGSWPRLLATRDGWLWLAERTVGGLAATLRRAFLIMVGFLASIVLIGLVFGFTAVLLGLLVGVGLLLVRATVLLPRR